MAEESQSTVQFVNPHPMKIDMVKFEGKNNFGMWRCEVMDALTASNFEDTLRLEEKPEETSKKNWNKMNRIACGLIRPCLTQDIKYHVLYDTSAMKMWKILEKKYQEYRVSTVSKEEALSLPVEEGTPYF